MIIITGGLGFIGTNLAHNLLKKNEKELVLCDKVYNESYFHKNKIKTVEPKNLFVFLGQNKNKIEAVIHLGAISNTTERNLDIILENNYYFSLDLLYFCAKYNIKFIYASSAATYGDGLNGFEDELTLTQLCKLKPLNPYGWSKHLFDIKVFRSSLENNSLPDCWAGLKFFNVYGPYEAHKSKQASVASQMIKQINSGISLKLFRSHNILYKDGEQLRDFIFVDDCVNVINWILKKKNFSGLYNVGTGKSRKFIDLARCISISIGKKLTIDWADTPIEIREQYQYFTEANMTKLYKAGYNEKFASLEEGIAKYIEYLK